VAGKDWPLGYCANGHPNSQRTHEGSAMKKGRRRRALYCAPCIRTYQARHHWRTNNPGEPMPEHLLLASEKN
jgi:hypothetical protein